MSDAAIIALVGLAATILGFWNSNHTAERNHRWDMEERERNTAKIIEGTERAYNESNHANKKIEALHEENVGLHKEVKAVLKVVESVKSDTGSHKSDRAERP